MLEELLKMLPLPNGTEVISNNESILRLVRLYNEVLYSVNCLIMNLEDDITFYKGKALIDISEHQETIKDHKIKIILLIVKGIMYFVEMKDEESEMLEVKESDKMRYNGNALLNAYLGRNEFKSYIEDFFKKKLNNSFALA